MKKRLIIYVLLYYCLVPIVIFGVMVLLSTLLNVTKARNNLGAIIIVTNVFLFFAAPVIDAVMMRFSPFKFYVDPLAAFEIPAFLYVAMVINQFETTNNLRSAVLLVNNKLLDASAMGLLFLIGLFIFGVLTSFSIKRKHGQNIAYRIIDKPYEKRTANPGLSS